MFKRIFGSLLGIVYLLAGSLPAARQVLDERWTLGEGQTYETRLVEVRGPIAFFAKDRVIGNFPWSRLIETDRAKVEAFAAAQAEATRPDWSTTDSPFWKRLQSRVFDYSGEKKLPFRPPPVAEPDFYVVYFGAGWCPPCRDFVPRLNAWYQSRRAMGFENFEVFYLGWDKSAADQAAYIREAQMAFPALKLGSDQRLRELRLIRPDSIPGLVVFDRDGFPLYHSHKGEVYRGPDIVLEELHQLLLWSNPDHPLAVLQRFELTKRMVLKQQGKADRAPRIYHTTDLPAAVFGGREGAFLKVTLTISEKGTVDEVLTEESLSPAILAELQDALYDWLFIPAIRDGAFARTKVRVPLKATH